jgi:hypothetical protein
MFFIFIQLQIVNFDDIRDLYLFQILTTFKSETTEFPSIVVMEYVGQSSLQNVLEEFPHLLKSTFVMRFIFLDLNLNSFFSYPTDNRSQLLKLLALNLDVLVKIMICLSSLPLQLIQVCSYLLRSFKTVLISKIFPLLNLNYFLVKRRGVNLFKII